MGEKKEELIKIVGDNNVLDDPETLDSYSSDYSFVPSRKPWFVVKARNADEVQRIVEWANRTVTPLVPVSSGPPHFRGDTVPSEGGAVIVDLSEMKRIITIDGKNRMTIVEPGVTYSQLQPELAKEGLRLSMPLLPRRNKSVAASLIEREPTLIPKYRWLSADPLRCLEIVWGNGDKMMTGEAGNFASIEAAWKRYFALLNPRGPAQVDYYRLVQAAQGTMGIVTWTALRCEKLPKVQKLFLVPAKRLDELLDFAYRLLRFRFGDEFLFLNSFNLACILGEVADVIKALRDELPRWVLILSLSGRDILPEEKVEFLEKDIADIAQQFGLRLISSVPGASSGRVLEAILNPSKEPYWKLGYKGGCQDIFFLTTLNRTPEFVRTMYSVAEAQGYPASDIGIYIQPVHQGASCHCEFSLPYDRSGQVEVTKMQGLFTEASEQLLKEGAFFSRPYGFWADMAYNKDTQTTMVLKKVKDIFDPNHVMNAGKLCF
ncbi:MAG TPA: FAD-binding oxidoreductase [Dehalococcoidia bacterium]|nr:FAD-binding oxidoreductase [Dehalococcoidia bacterium]